MSVLTCRHCGKTQRSHLSRNLCSKCHQNLEIRNLYPLAKVITKGECHLDVAGKGPTDRPRVCREPVVNQTWQLCQRHNDHRGWLLSTGRYQPITKELR